MKRYFIISKENLSNKKKVIHDAGSRFPYHYVFKHNTFVPDMEKVCGVEISKEEYDLLGKHRPGNYIQRFKNEYRLNAYFTQDMIEIREDIKKVGKFKISKRC